MRKGSSMIHQDSRRWLFLLLAVSLFLGIQPVHAAQTVQQLTNNTSEEEWGNRHSTTSQGKVLWFDENNDIFFYNGTSASLVQAFDAGDPSLDDIDDIVFALGSGASSGQVVGDWRRGTDFAWVWVNDGTNPKLVQATNPIDPTQPLNPEAVAIADGCVFMALQAFFGGNAVKHLFRINPATGVATNLTGSTPVPGLFSRITTSGCQAAWLFDDDRLDIDSDGDGNPDDPIPPKLHFYDGATVRVIDSGDLDQPHLSQGRLVYPKKDANGIRQISLYDSTAPSPTPVQLTAETDPTKGNFFPRTDGRHVAWLHGDADGTDQDILLNGGLQLTNDETRLVSAGGEHPFQLHRGQLLWKDGNGVLRYADGGGVGGVDITPATTVETPWLADGFIAFLGLSQDGGTDREVFLFTGTPPADASQPSPPLFVVATPGDGQVTVAWDQVIKASSYNLYMASVPGVTKDNYSTLPDGMKFAGVTSPFVHTGLAPGKTYYFVVTAVEDGVEGPNSREAAATVIGTLTWVSVGGLSTISFHAVAADKTDGSIAYAAGGRNVYKTTDGGNTWSALTGGIEGLDVRALAVNGPTVFAASRDIFGGEPSKILRSANGGISWEEVVPNGGEIGETNKSLAIDPMTPTTLYAGDFRLPEMDELSGDSFVIKSTDGGDTWFHLKEPAEPEGAEIRAYALAIDPLTSGKLYAGGTGTPNLVKSTDGGATWTNVSPAPGFVYALAIDHKQPATLYAGEVDSTQTSLGIFKSPNGGGFWRQKNAGFPTPLPRINTLLVDPANPAYLHAGTDMGYFYSVDGGEYWTAANDGLPTGSAQFISALALTPSRHLIAATAAGLFLLDLSGEAKPESCLGTGLSLLVGRVKMQVGRGIPDVTLTLNGPDGCTDTTTTNAFGIYRFRGLAKGAYTVTPGKTGCTFTPSSREVTMGGLLGIAGFSGTCP